MALVPVSEWIWNRYEISFLNKDKKLIKTNFLVSTDDHLECLINERANLIGGCEFWEWKIVKENVSIPKIIGHLYGMKIRESGWEI